VKRNIERDRRMTEQETGTGTGTGSELRRTYRGQRKKVAIGCEVKPDHIGKKSSYEWLQKQ